MKTATYIVLALISFVFATAASRHGYITTHVAGLDEWSIIFPAESGRESYYDYRLALQIVEVECDGKKIEPAHIDAMVHFNYETIPPSNDSLIYALRYYEFRTAVRIGGKFSDERILEYRVPRDTKRIFVRYRVRYPRGEDSEVFTIQSADRQLSPIKR